MHDRVENVVHLDDRMITRRRSRGAGEEERKRNYKNISNALPLARFKSNRKKYGTFLLH